MLAKKTNRKLTPQQELKLIQKALGYCTFAEDEASTYEHLDLGNPDANEIFGDRELGMRWGCILEVHGPESCITGDTFVGYSLWKDDKRINHKGGTIRRLYERFHGLPRKGKGYSGSRLIKDAEFFAPSINDQGRIFSNRIEDVVYTGEREVFSVISESGLSIRATADERFFTGTKFKRLSDLCVGDVVQIHLNVPYTCEYAPRPQYAELFVKHHPIAAVKIIDGKYFYHRLRKSRAIIEAYNNGLSLTAYIKRLNAGDLNGLVFLPRWFHVHHKDEDWSNDRLDNLVVLDASSHGKLHAQERHNNLRFMCVPDRIFSITPCGTKKTYDLKMAIPFNNYVAAGFVVHNSGKTWLATKLAAIAQQSNEHVYVAKADLERTNDNRFNERIGIDMNRFYLFQAQLAASLKKPDARYEQSAEQVCDEIEAWIKFRHERDSLAKTVLIIDSVTGMLVSEEDEGGLADQNMRTKVSLASFLSLLCRRWVRLAANYKVIMLFINQERMAPGVMYGSPIVTSGGRALKFYSSVRVRVRRCKSGRVLKEGKVIGLRSIIMNEKNKVGGREGGQMGFKGFPRTGKWLWLTKEQAEREAKKK